MFFNKVKKIVSQLGPAVQNTLKPPFAMTSYLDRGNFSPPANFWFDPYIQGFVISQTNIMLDLAFGGRSLSPQKRGEVLIGVCEFLIPEDAQPFLNQCLEKMKAGGNADPEFLRGSKDAGTLVGAAFGILKPDDPDPVLQEARKLAPSVHSETGFLAGEDASEASSLAAAVSMLTISKHVKERFLRDGD